MLLQIPRIPILLLFLAASFDMKKKHLHLLVMQMFWNDRGWRVVSMLTRRGEWHGPVGDL